MNIRHLVLALALTAPVTSPAADSGRNDVDAVGAVIASYHAALGRGDADAALALLAADALVLESGGIEDRSTYQRHHLAADMEFSRTVKGTQTPLRVTVQGDTAWAAATSVSTGTFRGRAVDTAGAELMVLTRTPAGWRIRAIHWSSRARPSSP